MAPKPPVTTVPPGTTTNPPTTTTTPPPTTTAPSGAPTTGQYPGSTGGYVDLWAGFDPGIFYRYSTLVYPQAIDTTQTTPSGPVAGIDIHKADYDYLVIMATNIMAVIDARGEPHPSWYQPVAAGEDIFGLGKTYHTPAQDYSTPPTRVQAFMAWWEGVKDNDNWTPILASAAARMGRTTDTALEYIEIGAPGARDSRIFAYDDVIRLIDKYGVDFLDLEGPFGYDLLETAAISDLPLEALFDIATTAEERHRSTRTVTGDVAVDLQATKDAVARAVREYDNRVKSGYNHVQAKIFAFGGPLLGNRVMGIGSGTMESLLTDDEISAVVEILGPNWQIALSEMDPFTAQDSVGAFRFAGYLDTLLAQEPIEVAGDTMREAARVLAEGWRVRPLSDADLDQMVTEFGIKMRESEGIPPVWNNIPANGRGSVGPGHPARDVMEPSRAGPLVETPDMRMEAMGAVRGSEDYERLYQNKPTDMSEEEWISRFSGAGASLMGAESRMATEVGMETGDMVRARQTAISDPSARGGTWYRRMAQWRKAFQ